MVWRGRAVQVVGWLTPPAGRPYGWRRWFEDFGADPWAVSRRRRDLHEFAGFAPYMLIMA
jgi:hypothetical protein